MEKDLISTQIAQLMADTAKINKQIKWYEAVLLVGGTSTLTLAIVAITKGFL